jgi:Na+/H+ antiporter NhaD/arsenite permease-like protein
MNLVLALMVKAASSFFLYCVCFIVAACHVLSFRQLKQPHTEATAEVVVTGFFLIFLMPVTVMQAVFKIISVKNALLGFSNSGLLTVVSEQERKKETRDVFACGFCTLLQPFSSVLPGLRSLI